jgi:tRNA 2-selenouridine synthase SelU
MAQIDPPATQQQFENNLIHAWKSLPKTSGPILVEIENVIGPIQVPQNLRKKIYSSPMIYLKKSMEDRIQSLSKIYAPYWNDLTKQKFLENLHLLSRYFSNEELKEITCACNQGDIQKIVKMLLDIRYDKSYMKSIQRQLPRCIAEFDLSENFEESLQKIANLIGTDCANS